MLCTFDDLTVEGQNTNIGRVSGQPVGPDGADYGERIESNDPANYFGADVGIEIVKRVNGEDANSAPGPTLVVGETATFTYAITNTGNLDLVDLELIDDRIGTITCPTRVDAGQTVTCQASAVVERDAYVNVGVATAQPVFVGSMGTEVEVGEPLEAEDPAHYYGEIVDVSIIKRVNGLATTGADGVVVEIGEPLVFTYEVTNTGNVDLSQLEVDDDVLGPITCPVGELAAGASTTCTRITPATSGTVTNIGTATARRVDTDQGVFTSVSSDDSATYTTRRPTPILAFTGGSAGRVLLLGFALLLGGIGILASTRRRERFGE